MSGDGESVSVGIWSDDVSDCGTCISVCVHVCVSIMTVYRLTYLSITYS